MIPGFSSIACASPVPATSTECEPIELLSPLCRASSILISGLALVLLCCGPASSAGFTLGQPVMGTILELRILAADPAEARRSAAEVVAVARHWDDVLTTWRPDGELAALNRRSGAAAASISADLRRALRNMTRLWSATQGAFDPAVAPIVEHWRGSSEATPSPAVATLGEVLRWSGDAVALAAGASLDAAAIAKGIALDEAAARLRQAKLKGAFLDFGGSSQLALGLGVQDRPWQVAIAGIRVGTVHGTVLLHDTALSTSRALPAGDRAGTIIDPRSGQPVAPPRLATVLARDATTAEAWSTALVVLGRSGLARAEQAGVEAIFEDERGMTRTAGFPLRSSP